MKTTRRSTGLQAPGEFAQLAFDGFLDDASVWQPKQLELPGISKPDSPKPSLDAENENEVLRLQARAGAGWYLGIRSRLLFLLMGGEIRVPQKVLRQWLECTEIELFIARELLRERGEIGEKKGGQAGTLTTFRIPPVTRGATTSDNKPQGVSEMPDGFTGVSRVLH